MRFFNKDGRYTKETEDLDQKVLKALKEIFDHIPNEDIREIHAIVDGAVEDFVCSRILGWNRDEPQEKRPEGASS